MVTASSPNTCLYYQTRLFGFVSEQAVKCIVRADKKIKDKFNDNCILKIKRE